MINRISGLAIIMLFQVIAYGQKINFQHITSSDGLSQSEVYSFLEDSRGFMWFGTLDGLNRYDGYKITIYNTEKNNPHSISNNTIRSLCEDGLGRIWIGTDDGLSVYNPKSEEINQVKISQFQNERLIIYSMIAYGKHLILGTSSGLLKTNTQSDDLQFIEDSFQRVQFSDNDPLIVSSIIKGTNGVIWVSAANSVFSLVFQEQNENPIMIDRISDERFDNIRSMTMDHFNNLWFCTYNSGFFRYNTQEKRLDQFTRNTPNETLVTSKASSITSDQNGNIWIGTRDKGLLYLSNEFTQNENPTFSSIQRDPYDDRSLNSNLIFSLYFSKSNLLWVGTIGSGIDIYDPQQKEFFHYKIPPEKDKYRSGSNFIRSVYADRLNNIWVGTHSNGLYLFNRDTHNYEKLGYGTQSVYYILGLDDGKTVICTSEGVSIAGLSNDQTLNTYQTPIRHASFYAYEDAQGFIWLATLHGLFKCSISDGQLTIRKIWDSKTKPGLSFNNCRVLHYSKFYNEIYVGTEGGGLNILKLDNNQEVTDIDVYKKDHTAHSISNNYIRTIIEDEGHNIWLGTYEGLNKLVRYTESKSITFRSYSQRDGLPNNMVQLLVQDNDGNIWVGTNNGLCKFDPKVDDFIHYSITDGIQSNEFSEHAVYKQKDGEIIVGGINGFNTFYPEKIQNNSNDPEITITDFYLFNDLVKIKNQEDSPLTKSISLTDSLFLQPHQTNLAFEFSALIYSNQEKVQYAYKLEGFDADWHHTDSKTRLANYTNLEYGKYIFKVKATNSDGEWIDAAKELYIHIKTPFVYTWMAFVIYILFIILMIIYFTNYTVMKYTTKKKILLENEHNLQLHELDELRTRFFINISHDLKTPLTLISSPLKLALGDKDLKEETKNRLIIADRNVQKLSYITEQLLDISKAEAGKLRFSPHDGDFVSFIKLESIHFSDAIRNKGLQLNVLTDYDAISCRFDTDIISKIFFNLMSNAIKYTHEGEINVRIDLISKHKCEKLGDSEHSQFVQLEIQDSGNGIPQDELNKVFDRFYQGNNQGVKGYGIGLSHCKDLVEAHKGVIEAESEAKKGTTFRIFIPKITAITDKDGQDKNSGKTPEIHIKSILEGRVNEEHSEEVKLQKVLVIEDNTDMRGFIQEELAKHYIIVTAENGLEGHQMAEKHVPDLIISDIMMPEMNGLEFCEMIKTNIKTSHIPVILLTAKGDDKTKYESIENGADDFIPKPFDMEYLTLRVKNLLDSKEKMREKFQANRELEPSTVASTSLDKKFLSELMSVLEEGIPDPEFTVNTLESKMGMSHTNFYRKLKTLTGQSGKEILMSMRMKRAKQILTDRKGVRISEVAYCVGFSNPKYFSKCFKEYYGVLPSDLGDKN